MKLYATRSLTPYINQDHAGVGDGFVDALREANEEFVKAVKDVFNITNETEKNAGKREAMAEAYVSFVREWCAREIDWNLVSAPSFPSIHLQIPALFSDCDQRRCTNAHAVGYWDQRDVLLSLCRVGGCTCVVVGLPPPCGTDLCICAFVRYASTTGASAWSRQSTD